MAEDRQMEMRTSSIDTEGGKRQSLIHRIKEKIRRVGNAIRKVNSWIADRLSNGLATMWTFWILSMLIVSTLLIQLPSGAQGWILFVVSVFFQGVALPVLALVSNRQGDRMESVLRETHDAVLDELRELRAMHEELAAKNSDLIARFERLSEEGKKGTDA